MDNRSWLTGAVVAPPVAPATPSVGYPTNGNPMTGDPATQGGAWWFHQIGEELRAIQVAAGIVPSAESTTQLLAAILSITQKAGDARHPVYAGDAVNLNDALSVTFATQLTALYDGMEVTTDVADANATTAPTFNLTLGTTATGDKTILNHDGTAVAVGAVHGRVTLGWVPTSDAWVLLNTSSVMNQAQADARYAALAGLTTQVFNIAPATAAPHAMRFEQVHALADVTLTAAALDATTKANAALDAAISAGFGVGQILVDVTASRVLGATYTNATGKPIFVMISFLVTVGSYAICSVIPAPQIAIQVGEVGGSGPYQTRQSMAFIVQAGDSYDSTSISGTVTIDKWSEFR